MNKFSVNQSLFGIICLILIHQLVIVKCKKCAPPKIGEDDKLLIQVIDNGFLSDGTFWGNMCEAVRKFPEDKFKVELIVGTLATKEGNELKCDTADCMYEIYYACQKKYYGQMNDCFKETQGSEEEKAAADDCYQKYATEQTLLDNAKYRENLHVPQSSLPTLALNKSYDPCVKTGSAQEFEDYFCSLFKGKSIGPCK